MEQVAFAAKVYMGEGGFPDQVWYNVDIDGNWTNDKWVNRTFLEDMIENGKRLGLPNVGIKTDYHSWDTYLGSDYRVPHDKYNMKVWYEDVNGYGSSSTVTYDQYGFNFNDWYMGGWTWPNYRTFATNIKVGNCNVPIDLNYGQE